MHMGELPMSIRPVAIEITLPSGFRESLTRPEAEAIIERMQAILHSLYPPSRTSLLIRAAAEACGITTAEIKSSNRSDACCLARWLVWEVMRQEGKSLDTIGKVWGGEVKDHGTVLNGLRRLKEYESQPYTWQAKAIANFRNKAAQLLKEDSTA